MFQWNRVSIHIALGVKNEFVANGVQVLLWVAKRLNFK